MLPAPPSSSASSESVGAAAAVAAAAVVLPRWDAWPCLVGPHGDAEAMLLP